MFICTMPLVPLMIYSSGARARRIAKIEFDDCCCRFTMMSGRKEEYSAEELRTQSVITWNGFSVKYKESWLSCFCDSLPLCSESETFLNLIRNPKVDRFERQWTFLFPIVLSCIPLILLGFACFVSTTEYYAGFFPLTLLLFMTAAMTLMTYLNAIRANQFFRRAPTARFIFRANSAAKHS